MIDERDCRRLARFFAGECSADEARETEAWLAEDPGRRGEADHLRELWRASRYPAWTPDADVAWKRLSARVHAGEPQSALELRQPSTRRRFAWRGESAGKAVFPFLAAAGALIAIALGFQEVRERVSRTRVMAPTLVPAEREFRTARGQRAVITLGDGSRVELGAASVLRVRATGDGPRIVTLEGQAVFDVVHDTIHPFEVRSANAITEDIGTRFTVRAYRGDPHVQVLVTSGKVNLRASGSPVGSGTLLGPMDLGVLDASGHTTVRNGVDSTSYLAWTRDRLVFQNAPLKDVLDEISRWFDVSIEVPDKSLLARRITINVPARSLSEVLGAVTEPLRLRSTIRTSSVVIQ